MNESNSYPVRFIDPVQLLDGTLVQLRPIHPIDGSHAREFREKLSAQSIYDRFLGYIPKISEKLVKRLTMIDYATEMAIVAEVATEEHVKEIIAVARIASEKGQKQQTEFAIIIADDWQGKGLGKIMTNYMIHVAREMGFEKMYSLVFSHNVNMLNILKQQGFTIRKEDDMTECAELDISDKDGSVS